MATRNSASESLQFLAATKTITASHIVTKMEQATRLAMYLTSQIHFFTDRLRSELPAVWLIVSDRSGRTPKLELLKSYLRLKKYNASDFPVVTKKKVEVSRSQYLTLLRTVYDVGRSESRKKAVFAGVKRAAKKKWKETAEGTDLISPISPSPDSIVDLCLSKVSINSSDIFYDLGCGDGRWLCRAATLFKCKCVGLEIEERRLKLAIENVKTCKLENYVEIKNENILTSDISSATIVLCYLFQDAMEQIGKTLRQRLQPGTKIIAIQFKLPSEPPQSWKPEKIYKPAVKDSRTVYYYTI